MIIDVRIFCMTMNVEAAIKISMKLNSNVKKNACDYAIKFHLKCVIFQIAIVYIENCCFLEHAIKSS